MSNTIHNPQQNYWQFINCQCNCTALLGRTDKFQGRLGHYSWSPPKLVSFIIIVFVNVGISWGSTESSVLDNCHFTSLCLTVHPGNTILSNITFTKQKPFFSFKIKFNFLCPRNGCHRYKLGANTGDAANAGGRRLWRKGQVWKLFLIQCIEQKILSFSN